MGVVKMWRRAAVADPGQLGQIATDMGQGLEKTGLGVGQSRHGQCGEKSRSRVMRASRARLDHTASLGAAMKLACGAMAATGTGLCATWQMPMTARAAMHELTCLGSMHTLPRTSTRDARHRYTRTEWTQ